jgi:Protein of unknown function (DUF4232)
MNNERMTNLVRVGLLTTGASLAIAAPGLSSSRSVARCQTRQLHLAAGFYGEAMGSFTQTFTFTNDSRHACQLAGWPRLKLASQSSLAVAVASRRVVKNAPPAPAFATIVLKPRGAASFNVYGADWNHAKNRSCPETNAALIAPPGDFATLSVAVRMPNCGLFYIAPLIAGSTDHQAWSVVWHRVVLSWTPRPNRIGSSIRTTPGASPRL